MDPVGDLPPDASAQTALEPPVVSPPTAADHELIRVICSGSYGEVWLGRNTLGVYRAVKVVHKKTFQDDRPFQREFNGVRKFEPVSRQHGALVDVLQVGRDERAGCFYYVMELADDVISGAIIDPGNYKPRTLAQDIRMRGRLPVSECLNVGAAIASALAFLHDRGLVHRDVKPSNIVFVNGQPKLADVGLMAEASEARSYVGTEGFIPPEGPGTVRADIYSLGKVLYEMVTGKDRQDYPDLPTNLEDKREDRALLKLNEIIVSACRSDPSERYASVKEMLADMAALQHDPEDWQRRRGNRRRVLGAGIAVGLVALCGLVVNAVRSRLDLGVHTSFPPRVVNASFAGPIKVPTGNGPMRVAVADFDGDGRPEVATAVAYDHLIAIYRNSTTNGVWEDRNLVQALALPFGEGREDPLWIKVGDLDGDGRPDLVASNQAKARVGVFRNTSTAGKLSFADPVYFSVDIDPRGLAIRDLNGDGLPEIICANLFPGSISILQNTSLPGQDVISFGGRVDLPVVWEPHDVASEDLDGDGKPDLAVAGASAEEVTLYRNIHTTGALTPKSFAPRVNLNAPYAGHSILIADVDGDDRADLVLGSRTEGVAVFQNRAAPGTLSALSFAPAKIFSAGGKVHQVAVGDLNGDRKPEILAATEQPTHLSVFENCSTPGVLFTSASLRPHLDLPAGWNCSSVTLADLDLDGHLDVVLCSAYTNVVMAYKNLMR